MYISDYYNHRIRKVIKSTGLITTIAGTGTSSYSGDGTLAAVANIAYPQGINIDSANNVYFTDFFNTVRKITVSTGIISTVAGTDGVGYNGDNIQATAALFYGANDVVLDSYDNLYITDRYNHRIRKVEISTGVITTVVGTGTQSSIGDGSEATSATINNPCYSRFDNSGNYYFTEAEGNRVRKVVYNYVPTPSSNYPSLSPSSVFIITTIAGSSTSASYSGDNGQATSAELYWPFGVRVDTAGNNPFYSYLILISLPYSLTRQRVYF